MDQLFAQVVDHIALSGSAGSSLQASLTAVLGHQPRKGILIFLYRQFTARPQRFCLKPNSSAPADEVVIIAHGAIRLRALGFSSLEQPALPRQALQILERVGMARSDGILQSELGHYVGLAPNMVHHYLGGLVARSLVARKKVVLTKRKAQSAVKKQPEPVTSQPDQLKPLETNSNKTVTYTAVVVLTRYAPMISQSSASRPLISLTESSNAQDDEDEQYPSKSPSVIDLPMETRVHRVMQALQPEPHTRSEKDMKVIAMPDSDRPPIVTEEHFRRRRHRCYRALRAKLERAGLVEIVHRECRARNGKSLGRQACMKLTELGLKKLNERKDAKLLAEDFCGNPRSVTRDVHALLQDGTRARFVEEVGVVEQVYQLLKRAGKEGISIPEMNEYFDGGFDLTALPSKRIRRIVDAIGKAEPIVETQRFEGSAMYLRIALKSLRSPGEGDDAKDSKSEEKLPNPHGKPLNGRTKRRKFGVTSLGQRRQEIVLQLLKERKVILLEPLGREVAVIEGSGLQRVDPKVLRRLLNDLLKQNVIKIITAMKPSIKESKRNQTVTIVASPEVQETCDEVRTLVTSAVNRTLYGGSDDAAPSPDKAKSETKEQLTTRKRKRARRSKEDENEHEVKTSELEKNEDNKLVRAGSDETESHIVVEEEQSSGDGLDGSTGKATPANYPMKQLFPVDSEKNVSDQEGNCSAMRKDPDPVRAVALVSERSNDNGLLDNPAQDLDRRTSSKNMPHDDESNRDDVESSDEFVVADVVGKKMTRITKLRAIDYGMLKGKMARVRSFHKTMYLILRRDQNSEVLDQPVAHCTIEATSQVDVLGCFTISDIISNMTVNEYAAAIGLYQDHGDVISSLNEEKISTVRLKLEDEVEGQTSARQILNLVQTLTKLGLVESGGNSQWALSGGGLIRDFGRGMPSGVLPHGIIFSSMKAVDAYWRELEQFARCRMSRRPLHAEAECIEDETKPFGKEIDKEMRFVSDVYFPIRWATGVVRLQKRDQLIYESMLQLLSGVQLELNLPNTLITTSFVDRPLKRFSIEELEEAFEKYRDRIPSLRATQRSMPSHEKLLLYARYRMKNPIPPWIRERENKLRRQSSSPENLEKEFIGDHTCILHLSSKAAEVEGCYFRAGIPTLGKRQGFSGMIQTRDDGSEALKVRKTDPKQCASNLEGKGEEKKECKSAKDKAKSKATDKTKDIDKGRAIFQENDDEEVDVEQMLRVCKAIIRSRAIAYYCNNTKALEWRAVTNWIGWYVRTKLEEEMGIHQTVFKTVKSLVNAMVKFCDIAMIRSALDSLALKVVIQGQITERFSFIESDGKAAKMRLSQCVEDVLNSRKELEHVLRALLTLQRHDLKYIAKVELSTQNANDLPSCESAQRMILKEFELDGLVYGREELVSHMLEVMSFRYRRVADMHMRENVSHGMLVRCMSETGAALRKQALCCTKWVARSSTSRFKNCTSAISQNETEVGEKNGKDSAMSAGILRDEHKHGDVRGASLETEANGRSNEGENVSAVQNSCGRRKYRQELVELVVQIVGREHSYRQDSEKSRELLDKFCWSDVALARDSLLLRGALTYRDERDNGSGSFVVTKKGGGNEYLSMLRDEDEVSTRWMAEIYKAEDEVCWEKSKLREAVCDKGEASVSSVATNLLTKKMFFMNDGVCMMARMSKSGASKEAIRLSVKRVENDWTWDVKRKRRNGVRSELKSEVRRRLLCAIGESGSSGKLLSELLELIKARNDEERAAVVWGLQALLRDECIHRFVVEQGDVSDEQFGAWHGVLYVSRSHCEELVVQQDVWPKSNKAVAWWRDTHGAADEQLIRGVRDCVLNALSSTPGVGDAALTAALSRRLSGAPRRAALDVAWALRMGHEISVECCVRDGDALTGRWRLCAAAREMDFVDGLGVFGWRRAWRCAWSVQARVRGCWDGVRQVARLLDERHVFHIDSDVL